MLTDESLMPWGIYEGKKMIEVPADYLLWLYRDNKCDRQVKEYIEENMQVLEKELKNSMGINENEEY